MSSGLACAQVAHGKGGLDARKRPWSFEPLRTYPLPKVLDATWSRTFVDRFLLAALERAELKPAPDADPATLIRRVTFD